MQSIVEAIKHNFKAKSTFKGKLDSYRFCDNVRQHPLDCCCSSVVVVHDTTCKSVQVWTFILSDTKFKTNFTNSAGPTAHAPEVTVDKVQIVVVDAKMFDAEAGAS